PSRYQFADIFTKGLPLPLFAEFCSSLSVRPPPTLTATTKGLPSPLFAEFRSSLSVQPPPALTAEALIRKWIFYKRQKTKQNAKSEMEWKDCANQGQRKDPNCITYKAVKTEMGL
ncbi:hypothetical protein Tco_1513953, partial [Tanacetum coccineum]